MTEDDLGLFYPEDGSIVILEKNDEKKNVIPAQAGIYLLVFIWITGLPLYAVRRTGRGSDETYDILFGNQYKYRIFRGIVKSTIA